MSTQSKKKQDIQTDVLFLFGLSLRSANSLSPPRALVSRYQRTVKFMLKTAGNRTMLDTGTNTKPLRATFEALFVSATAGSSDSANVQKERSYEKNSAGGPDRKHLPVGGTRTRRQGHPLRFAARAGHVRGQHCAPYHHFFRGCVQRPALYGGGNGAAAAELYAYRRHRHAAPAVPRLEDRLRSAGGHGHQLYLSGGLPGHGLPGLRHHGGGHHRRRLL